MFRFDSTYSQAARFLGLLMLALPALVGAQSITLGQVDDFQDGSVENWGGGANPVNVPSGGPGGAGDKYLRINSTGIPGPGGNLATFNLVQWAGNYTAAGVKVVEAWFKNEGADTLHIRIVMFGSLGSQWTSTGALVLPPGSGWTRGTFVLLESLMTRTIGTETFAQTMSGCTRLMFRNNPNGPSSQGVPTVSQLGIDNISALNAAMSTPSSFVVRFGAHLSGNLQSLQRSDDDRLVVAQDLAAEELNPIRVLVTGFTQVTSPTKIEFSVESSADANMRGQSIELWDFTQNRYELVGTGFLNLTDTIKTVVITTNPGRFVNPTTGEMRAAISVNDGAAEINQRLTTRIDHVVWSVFP